MRPFNTAASQARQTVTIVGAGGLGHAAAWGLATGASARLRLSLHVFDGDRVERSNLNRQVFFAEADIGKNKATALIAGIAPWLPTNVSCTSHDTHLVNANIEAALQGTDYVIDATDSIPTKLLINDYCVKKRLPFCYAGVSGNSGQLLDFHPQRANQPCLRCLFGAMSDAEAASATATCQQVGVFGLFVGHVGMLQADFALRYLGNPESAALQKPELWRLDGRAFSTRRVSARYSEDCPLECNKPSRAAIDLSQHECPLTYLYTKIALEKLPERGVLAASFKQESSAKSVEASCREEGHIVLSEAHQVADDRWQLLIQKRVE